MSVGYYPHAIINPWWNSAPFGGVGSSASFSPTNKWLLWRTVYLQYVTMCVGGDRVVTKYESGNFRLHTPKRHGSARLFVGTEYISLTQPDMDYLLRVFPDYIIALPDVLSYVTLSLASTSFVEPQANASTNIDYPHLYEELLTFV